MVEPSIVGHLKISQPEKGYRFSIDPLILAANVQIGSHEEIMDLGCGCGIMALLLAHRYPHLKITGIELQEELYHFSKQNVLKNGFEKNIRIVHHDLRTYKLSETEAGADIIISNPPYKKTGTGRINPNPQKAMARHEITLDVNQLVEASGRLIKDHGLLYIIFPFNRLSDLESALIEHGFAVQSIRHIHIREGDNPSRVIIAATKNRHEPYVVLPALFFYTPENKFTKDYLSLFRP